MAPAELSQSIGSLHVENENVLVGINGSDDGSVYRIDEDLALVQSVDFITPVVDDPYSYGQIAAANSLSDIYAMGSHPVTALNLVGFDSCNLTSEILNEILQGGISKIKESGAVLTGGHTVETKEMFYGLSASGFINPKKIWRNNTPKIGDILILTKPIGSGVISTVIKGDLASKEDIKEAIFYMSRLNKYAYEILSSFEVSACTDITGFGLLGHALEMTNEHVSLELYEQKIPYLKSAVDLSNMGLIPEGSYKNLEFVKSSVTCKKDVPILLCDAQTSGGLLVAVNEKHSLSILDKIRQNGDEKAQIIGQVIQRKDRALRIV